MVNGEDVAVGGGDSGIEVGWLWLWLFERDGLPVLKVPKLSSFPSSLLLFL